MNLVFMGSAAFAIPSLIALCESDHDVIQVVTQPDKPAGRGQKIVACPVAEYAREQNLPLFQPDTVKSEDVIKYFASLKADLYVVVAYGKILPASVLQLPKYGCINVHASLLPKYRGAAPIQWALINGEEETGVTTMYLNEEMDTGDIIESVRTPIDECETAEGLHDRLAVLGGEILTDTLEKISQGKAPRTKQDHKLATYASILKKEDGHIPWNLSAREIYNRIRGMTPWPGAFTFWEEKRLTIHEASPHLTHTRAKPGTVVATDHTLTIATGDGELYLLEVQLEGKKRMSAADFLRGHRLATGTVFT